jgi:hypothetical protein
MAPHFTPVGWDDRPTTHVGAIITAMVTPVDSDWPVDEAATAKTA